MKMVKDVLFAFLLVGSSLCFGQPAASKSVVLQVIEKKIAVNGKEATVLGIQQPDGTVGMMAYKGEPFNVVLDNQLKVPTSIHWHGLILPNNQDGVAFVTQYALYPGLHYTYEFPIKQAGTFFMHSHFGLQEQRLLAAPLILLDSRDADSADQEVVVLLSDFSFKSPEEIYQGLRCKKKSMNMAAMKKAPVMDVVEVDYDAFLANFKTLDDPAVFRVKPGTRVRLRLINASSATNFFIDLDRLEGEAIAVDGSRIQPLKGKKFELGIAQRIDIVLGVPEKGGFFPIYAKAEGTDKQTGIVLATSGSRVRQLPTQSLQKVGALTNEQELNLRALEPLSPKPVDQQFTIELGGDMANYVWTLNGQAWPEVTPVVVKQGNRVEIVFTNVTSMTHPMHLHGHVFQVTAIDGEKINGAIRDTVLVTPNSSVTIQFDADNPGVWPLHCHLLYHLEAGMFTVVRYEDFVQKL